MCNNSIQANNRPSNSKLDKINGIDMESIFEKRGHSPETNRIRNERNRILQPKRTKVVGKGKDNERVQAFRPSQQSRKNKLNGLI